LDADVIDLRTLNPLDIETVVASVKKTGRLLIVHEAPRTLGMGAEISALVAERALEYLLAPILRVTGPDTPFPYRLEDYYIPSEDRILRNAKKLLEYR
ncbi:MAG: transketolase C-terminal domain-containing protein, partial [Thermoplasmataceae archaeon]